MNLDRLRIFYYVAKAQSFTHSDLNLSPSAISRQIGNLEHEVKAQLFHRYARKLALTEKGQILFDLAKDIFTKLDSIDNILKDGGNVPEGLIRLSSPSGWGTRLILQDLNSYLLEYPHVRFSVMSDDHTPDFRQEKIDAAIYSFIPDEPNLKHVHLFTCHFRLFASQNYIDQFGMPKTAQDLDHHRLIITGESQRIFKILEWYQSVGFDDGRMREPFLRVNSLYYAAIKDLGIVPLALENPDLKDSRLIPVLPDLIGPELDIYFIYPKHLESSTRIKSLLTFLQKRAKFIMAD